jgi:hypothetical protein
MILDACGTAGSDCAALKLLGLPGRRPGGTATYVFISGWT